MGVVIGLAAAIHALTASGAPYEMARDDTVERSSGPAKRGVDVEAFVGYGIGIMRHPEYAQDEIMGAALSLDLGFALNPHWSVGVWLSTVQMNVERGDDGQFRRLGTNTIEIAPRLECDHCEPGLGGRVVKAPLMAVLTGPRVEYTPFGSSGPYAGIGAGVGAASIDTARVGGAFAWRGGYRHFFLRSLALGAGVEVQSLVAKDTFGALALFVVDLRLRFALSR